MKSWINKFRNRNRIQEKENEKHTYLNTKYLSSDVFKIIKTACKNNFMEKKKTVRGAETKAAYKGLLFLLEEIEYDGYFNDYRIPKKVVQVFDEETNELIAFGAADHLFYVEKVQSFITGKNIDGGAFYTLYPQTNIASFVIETIAELDRKNEEIKREKERKEEQERLRKITEQENKRRYLEEKYQQKRNQA